MCVSLLLHEKEMLGVCSGLQLESGHPLIASLIPEILGNYMRKYCTFSDGVCALTAKSPVLQILFGKKAVLHYCWHAFSHVMIELGRLLAMGEASCAVVRTGSCDVVCRMMRPVPEER